jgi:peptide/nickel transport system ATP-binding protein
MFDKQTKFSHPYTEGLMKSIPRLDTPPGTKLDVIPGAVPHPLDLPSGCKFEPRCKYATEQCRLDEPQMEHVSNAQQIRCFYPAKEARHEQ